MEEEGIINWETKLDLKPNCVVKEWKTTLEVLTVTKRNTNDLADIASEGILLSIFPPFIIFFRPGV